MAHGHEHGHGHGHGKIELPDYKQWKIEGTPLQRVQERLAKQGLRDPWGRNEAWRYMGRYGKPATLWAALTRGFKWGFGAFLLAVGVEYFLTAPKNEEEHASKH
ncbi:NADH dehydrogenase [ubiquinone] 1 beta subcomplex subunit 3 [Vombatus ursinus]|uniref:NADH dehydrogenase [ubiquinone] 1 beta subcomplex subunit 3 n=1 Tax=Vombatus ursinus TaxID=29139 RepID=A0A4X2KHM9_VOMUR|nr:NADH dehydrogenase [ubiquinone] 1 beta subcomplex subunit 3 [Vombatus ursinus]XP_027729254.1 NADH dehydrogenase [ubiquinone] 1 beta subcomplex subunit 3 [Vombatus ursinus]XP_027729255.1 NADH dehydrogenase [ubiquinone] 1 beta subcomplex subunit 3 [Vombatus ursinus]